MKKLNILIAYFYTFILFGGQLHAADYVIKKVWMLEINSSINPATLSYLEHNLGQMKAYNGDLALITMNTPGGLVTTTKDILTLMGKSEVPIVIWVTPQGASATSAGAIIAAGAHLLYMSDGTNIGAATPIGMGKDIEQSDARSKAINDLVALVTSLSKARERNAKEYASMIENAASYDSGTALEKNIINGIANSRVDLLQSVNHKSISILGQEYKLQVAAHAEHVQPTMDPGQKILNVLANPMLAYIFFIIGAALIYFELQAPGGLIAGSLGVVFLILAAISFQVLPLNYGALGLIVLAFVLFVLEIYVTSYGLLSLAGVASLVAGSLFLFRTTDSFIQIQMTVIFSVVAAVVLYLLLVAYMFAKGKDKKESFFRTSEKIGHIAQVLGEDGNKKIYMIKVAGEIWRAFSDQSLEVGQRVLVVAEDQHNLMLEIKAA